MDDSNLMAIRAALRAAEVQLEFLAAQHLPFSSCVSIQLKASRIAHELLGGTSSIGSSIGFLRDDETDELLSFTARAGGFRVPLDDGPEGSAERPLTTNESVEEEDDDTPTPRDESIPEPIPYDASLTYVSFERDPNAPMAPLTRMPDIDLGLVKFEIEEEEEEEEEDRPAYVEVEGEGDAQEEEEEESDGPNTEELAAHLDEELRETQLEDDEAAMVGRFADIKAFLATEREEAVLTPAEPEPEPEEDVELDEEVERALAEAASALQAIESGESVELLPEFEEDLDEAPAFTLEDDAYATGEFNFEELESSLIDQLDSLTDLEPLDTAEIAVEFVGEPEPEPAEPARVATVQAREPDVFDDARARVDTEAMPMIREHAPKPSRHQAAAIRIGETGKAEVLGAEAVEIEMLGAEDFDEAGGLSFSVELEEYEDDFEELEEFEAFAEPEPEPEPEPPPGPTASELEAMLDKAVHHRDNNEFDKAILYYSDVIDGDPEHLEAHLGRGQIYLDLGDYASAMSDFLYAAEDLAPNSPEPQVAIGNLFFARKDYRKAIEYFDHALARDSESAMALCRRGISHYYRKNYSTALKDLKRAKRIDAHIPNIGTYISMAKKKSRK